MTEHPSVTILVNRDPVVTIELGLSLVLDITALLARITAGRLVAVHAGRCDVTATLSIDETDALTRQGHIELPGTIRLGTGIRLLAAKDYPPGAGQPGSDDDPDQPGDQPRQMGPQRRTWWSPRRRTPAALQPSRPDPHVSSIVRT